MAENEIKAIIFDLGNVLLNYDAKIAAKRFAAECGIPLYKVWLHFFTSPTEKAYTRGEITTYEFYRHAKKAFGPSLKYREFAYYWNDIFTENPGMDDLLKKLKRRYPLFLISNTNRLHYEYIKKNFIILRHFKRKFTSHELGMRKPHARIYKTVLSKIGYDAHDTIFIDDARSFVAGAKKVGIHALHFRGREKLINDLRKLGVKI